MGKLEDIFSDMPWIITSSFQMEDPNQSFLIYEGEFIIKNDTASITITGKIEFTWLPKPKVKYAGQHLNGFGDTLTLFNDTRLCKLIINNIELSDCYVTYFGGNNIEGETHGTVVMGDRTIPVQKIKFSIPNFSSFLGQNIRTSETSFSKSRIRFENDDYIIIIDKVTDYDKYEKLLRSKGGYILLYTGELTMKNGTVSFKDYYSIIFCFSKFLSFVNGRRCYPVLAQGIYNEEIIWTNYTNYFSDSFKSVITWPHYHSIEGLNELWQVFNEMYDNEDNRDFLSTTIHWYLEANSNSGYTEGSIVMTQMALELIYNWLVVENNKIILGKDAENISASNKIRLLLSQFNISRDVPEAFKNLQKFTNSLHDVKDGPEALVQIRNAIVHSQLEKRKKSSQISPLVKYEALHLGIWYVEISLLKILKYKGKYHNRTLSKHYVGEGIESFN